MENLLATDLDYILQHTQSLWSELRGKRIFITGGTGFIGSWLLETFIWANEKFHLDLSIVVLTRDSNSFTTKVPHLATHPMIQFHHGDIRNFDFPSGEFNYVIHAATDLQSNDAKISSDIIIQGTRRTLEFATAANVQKFLFLSSGTVYGKQPSNMSYIEETYHGAPDTLNPSATYALSKRYAEHLCMLYAQSSNLEIKIARCFTFIGPYLPLNAQFAVGNFIRDRLCEKPIHILSDGTPCRSYQYASDLIIWLLHILCNGQSGMPYNVGSDDAISLLELATYIAEKFIPQLDIKVAKPKVENQLPDRYIPCVKRVINEFGLTMKVSLEDAVKKTIRWHQDLSRFNGLKL